MSTPLKLGIDHRHGTRTLACLAGLAAAGIMLVLYLRIADAYCSHTTGERWRYACPAVRQSEATLAVASKEIR